MDTTINHYREDETIGCGRRHNFAKRPQPWSNKANTSSPPLRFDRPSFVTQRAGLTRRRRLTPAPVSANANHNEKNLEGVSCRAARTPTPKVLMVDPGKGDSRSSRADLSCAATSHKTALAL